MELAAAVAGWGRLSAAKVEQAIDYWVDRYDPYALRRMETRARGRHVDWTFSDGRGASTIEAVLFDHDAATLDKRLDAMARAVCDADERTLDQRRADALGALARRRRPTGVHLRAQRLPGHGQAGQRGGDQRDRRGEDPVRRHGRSP